MGRWILCSAILMLASPEVRAEETLAQAKTRIEHQRMEDTSPADAFRYLSGHLPNNHNHPVIFAGGVGDSAKLYVVGNGVWKVYPMRKRELAYQAYEDLLMQQGYLSN